MNKEKRDYKNRFNKIYCKKQPFKLISKRIYFCLMFLSSVFLILLIVTIGAVLVFASFTATTESGNLIIRISHEISPETLETIKTYINSTLFNK